jgi:TPR repeat protein
MPEDNQKVPSQIFRWFEKMKTNYEQSVQGVLERFEKYSHSQQLRIDLANQSNINNLKQSHQKHLDQQNAHIKQLSEDVSYYKKQISKQQQTIEQLNGRYDAVISCLLTEKRKDIDIKDIFSDNEDENSELIEDLYLETHHNKAVYSPFKHQGQNDLNNEPDITTSPLSERGDDLFDNALLKRQSGDVEQAFQLFEQAAKLGHVKAMGAMGRAFFLAEGTEEDHSLGLAWLIHAANQDLPQAVARVKFFQDNNPELYLQALNLTADPIFLKY